MQNINIENALNITKLIFNCIKPIPLQFLSIIENLLENLYKMLLILSTWEFNLSSYKGERIFFL